MTRILIVDDNPKILKVLRQTLGENPEWSICGEAADGLEAVSKAAELLPDIVILDLTMPKLNGLQAGSAIRLAAPKIPLLLFTQHNVDTALENEARKSGFSGGVSKGSLNSLIVGIETLLRGETYFPSKLALRTQGSTAQPAETTPAAPLDEASDEAS
ncbi:MAG TPA: response regulator transcription factor [Candidatus Saccharimonadales bacterium]|nr:response regulator transcription factor [Candidatus Saccharimonadales bacterium]